MKKRYGKKAFVAIVAVIVLVISIGYGVFYHYYSMMNYQKEEDDSLLSSYEPETDGKLTTVTEL